MRQLIDFNFSTDRNMAPDEQHRFDVNIVDIINECIGEVEVFDYSLNQNGLDFTASLMGNVKEEIKDYDRKGFIYRIKRLALPIQEDSVKIVFRNII